MAENIPETPEVPKDLEPLLRCWRHEAYFNFTYVRGFSRLLLEGKAGKMDDEWRTMLEIMDRKSAVILDIWDSTLEYLAVWSGRTKLWGEKEPMSFEKVVKIVREVCDRSDCECVMEVNESDNSLKAEVAGGPWLPQVLTNLVDKRLDGSHPIPRIANPRFAISVGPTNTRDIQIQIRTDLDLRQKEERRQFYEYDRHFILANLMLREYAKPVTVLPLDDGARFSFELSRQDA